MKQLYIENIHIFLVFFIFYFKYTIFTDFVKIFNSSVSLILTRVCFNTSLLFHHATSEPNLCKTFLVPLFIIMHIFSNHSQTTANNRHPPHTAVSLKYWNSVGFLSHTILNNFFSFRRRNQLVKPMEHLQGDFHIILCQIYAMRFD